MQYMDKPDKIAALHGKQFDWIPESIYRGIGHFNVFRLEPYTGNRSKRVSYRRPDYFNITLVIRHNKIPYDDKVPEIQKHSLIFSNPLIPFKWEYPNRILGGYYCLFDQAFFSQFIGFNQYEVFQPGGMHVFDLSREQVTRVSGYYERMFKEINSSYIFKYDVLRNLVFEMLHFAMKQTPRRGVLLTAAVALCSVVGSVPCL